MHPTLGILRRFQAFFYALSFSTSEGVPPPAPARVTQTVGQPQGEQDQQTEKMQTELLPNHQAIVDRFIESCQLDYRIVAAFLGGSYARGTADEFSDLDLYIVVSDDSFGAFNINRNDFLHLLGEPIFIEDFDILNIVFYYFANGTEGELGIVSESDFSKIHHGPYVILVDKKEILANVKFSRQKPDSNEQVEKLRRLIYWFWHDLSHFVTAMGRNQLWFAQGQLEELRGCCVNLARLRNNFSDPDVGDEPYFKIETTIPVKQMAVLRNTFCPIEKDAMFNSSLIIIRFYKELAISLAKEFDITYPKLLEQITVQRLENLQKNVS